MNVRDEHLRGALADTMPFMPWICTATTLLVVRGNGRRLRNISRLRGEAFANEDLDAFYNVVLDAGIVTGALVTAAEAIGLGTCPLSAIHDNAETVSQLLSLPNHVFPAVGLCLGWPAQSPGVTPRLPLSLTLHRERFNDDGWVRAIDDYDARRGKLAGFDPANPEFMGWSSRKSRLYATAQRRDFGTYVRARGFRLD